MTKGMKRRDVETELRNRGYTFVSSKGGHDKWRCPCGKHSANVPRHKDISPGVVSDIMKRGECIKEKGWLG